VRSLEKLLDIQSQYAKRVYENHMAELSKLAEMYTGMVRDASKPIREASPSLVRAMSRCLGHSSSKSWNRLVASLRISGIGVAANLRKMRAGELFSPHLPRQ